MIEAVGDADKFLVRREPLDGRADIDASQLLHGALALDVEAPDRIDLGCFVPTFPECVLAAISMASRVLERTEGQVQLTVSSYADKRLGGPENLALVSDGTLDLVEMFRFHAASELPLLDIQNLWGLYPDQETEFEAISTVMPDFDRLISEATGGRVVYHNWLTGDHFLYTKEPIRSADRLFLCR